MLYKFPVFFSLFFSSKMRQLDFFTDFVCEINKKIAFLWGQPLFDFYFSALAQPVLMGW